MGTASSQCIVILCMFCHHSFSALRIHLEAKCVWFCTEIVCTLDRFCQGYRRLLSSPYLSFDYYTHTLLRAFFLLNVAIVVRIGKKVYMYTLHVYMFYRLEYYNNYV